MKKFAAVIFALVAALPLTGTPEAVAQENFPDRHITMIMGWSAGGMGDTMLRLLSQSVSKELGQPVNVVNMPGAAGILGLNAVINAKPDGYTLGFSVSSNYLIAQYVRKLPVDLLQNSTQIACFFDYPFGLVVRSDAPWKTWNEFKEYAKQNPGKVNYATAGVGTTQHLAFERVAAKEGIKWTHVPYKGGNDTINALVGGHIDAAIQGPADVVAFIRDGRLKMLLTLNDKRWDSAPNAPTLLDAGYDFSAFSQGCIHGPKGMPESIRSKLEAVIQRVVRDPSFVERAKSLQVPVLFMGGNEYTKAIQDRAEGSRNIISTLGLQEN